MLFLLYYCYVLIAINVENAKKKSIQKTMKALGNSPLKINCF